MTPQRYFGGSSAKNGRTNLLRVSTFKELVEAYIFVPVPLPMKRHEFMAHPDRDKLKDGSFVVASSYDFDEGKRENHTATAVNSVIVDLDEGQFVKDFFESPDTILDAIYPFNLVVWTTAKHTPDEPRLKIMVDVKACHPDEHRRIALWVIRRLGLPDTFKGSRETLTLSLPQYRPVVFEGEEFSAILTSRLDGIQLDEKDAPALAPEDDDNDRKYAAYSDGDDLLSLPPYGITVEDIREPLFAVSADCEYKIWIEICCAIRSAFPQEDDAREAYHLWNEWSATGEKYRGEKETYLKWRSVAVSPKGRRPITIRTLYHTAMKAGWVNTKILDKVANHIIDWIRETDKESVLVSEGCRKIADSPFESEVMDEKLVTLLMDRLKELGTKISKATLFKQVKKERYRDRTETVRVEKPSWVMPFCFIGPQNLFRNTVTGAIYKPDAFNNTFSRYLVAPKDNDSDETSSRPVVQPSDKALNEVQIKVVDAELYDPRENCGDNPYFEIKGRWYVNTYLKCTIPKEVPEHANRAGKLFKKLLSVNLGNPEYERVVLDYFAFCVQNPGVILRWAIFMQGAQGCGKGTLIDMLKAAIGEVNVKVITASTLNSDFNEYRSGSQVVHIDEIKAPGKNRFDAVNKFKDAITNTIIPVNQKFKDVVNIPNTTNYFLTSNTIDALAMEDSDRRFYPLISLIQVKEQVVALNATGLLQEIHQLIVEHGGAFRTFLLKHEISADFPVNGPAPDNRFRQDMIDAAKNPLLVFIEKLIADEEHPLDRKSVV